MEKNTNKIAREVIRIYKDVDVKMKRVPKVCGEGCAHCCRQVIVIHSAEQFAIARYVKEHFSEAQLEAARERLRSWFAYFDANTPAGQSIDGGELQAFGRKHAADGMNCPFLVDSRCSIYPARPLICRTYSVNDSPDQCDATPYRPGSTEGYAAQDQGVAAIGKAAGVMLAQLLPHAVARLFGVEPSRKALRSASRPVR